MNKRMIVAGFVALAATAAAGAACANGCNGVVNQAVWGCAAWDNNNGPQYPNWKGARAPASTPQATLPANSRISSNGLIAGGGSNLVASGGGNLVASGGGNLVASGGGNMKPH